MSAIRSALSLFLGITLPVRLEKKPDRIYSIALDFDEETGRGIIINQDDFPKFKRHINSNGSVNMESLIEDHSLKIVLVRDVDYGPLTLKGY